jgi:hypothetical protein
MRDDNEWKTALKVMNYTRDTRTFFLALQVVTMVESKKRGYNF